ncbi:hypothetical protein FHW20_004471 [Ochrobactrum intermedium]|uniref:Uncharacterized protein n=1 Tax=Brucella intermedia TaxID=94625 RepID=A0ABR6AVJ3_9HYPH|nr:hypothetical protein [Brucella intermedia]
MRLLEQLRPDADIANIGLVLDSDTHHALRGTRPLPHQHQPGCHEPAPVTRIYRLDDI